jgi:glycosyltransferase involved in cell wall biosynthesis
MHVALIADSLWLDEELAQFQALVVGLIDEGTRVAQIVPDQLGAADVSHFGERVNYRESRWPWLQQYNLSRVRDKLDKLGVDLLHALTSHCWAGTLMMARQLDLPAVLTASSARDIEPAARLARQTKARYAIIATTAPLGKTIGQRQNADAPVKVIHPGVHRGATQPAEQTGDHVLCAVVTGNGLLDEHYQALLGAIPSLVRDQPHTQFFLDSQRHDQHALWQAARRLGILSNVSLVPRRPGHHRILLRADVLLAPQPLGQSRGLTLEAMARGIAVIAAADPWLDYLLPDETAWVINDPDRGAWERRLRSVIANRAQAAALGERARQWVGKTRIAAEQVDQTLDLYRQITGESIKFDEAKGTR